jgi:hypothetical protein
VFEVRLDRDLRRFLNELQPLRFNARFRAVRREFNDTLAGVAARLLRAEIDNLVPAAPVTADYLQRKIREGLDMRPWHATSYLVQNITSAANEYHVEVGWDKEATHPDHNQLLGTIARALEFGVADLNIPARPVVRPTLRKLHPLVAPLFRDIAYRRFKIPVFGKR